MGGARGRMEGSPERQVVTVEIAVEVVLAVVIALTMLRNGG